MANTVIGASVEIEFQSVGGLRKAIKDATSELIQMQEKFGMSSKEAVAAASKVAELKDRIRDAREQADLFDPGKKFQAFVNIGSTIAAGFSAIQGAMALVGSESENVQKAMMKLQGAMALAQGLSQLKEFGKAWDGLKGVIGNATKGLNLFGKAMLGIGIGAILAIVAAWDDIAKAIGLASENAEIYKEANREVTKELASFNENLLKVNATIEAAKNGVISKDDALKAYNDSLGDSLGKLTSYDQIEKRINAAAGIYIKMTQLKTQANVFFAKSAELSAKAMTGEEMAPSLLETIGDFITSGESIVTYGANLNDRVRSQFEENVNEAQNKAQQLQKEAERLTELSLEQQAELDKITGGTTANNAKAHNQRTNNAKTANDKQTKIEQQGEEARRLIQETSLKLMSEKDAELEKLRLQNIQNINKLELAGFKENSKERLDLKIAYENERAAIEKKYQDEADKKQKEYQDKLNAIELETRMAGITNVREKEIQELKNTYAEKLKEIETNENYNQQQREALITALTTQQQQAEKALNEKFRQEDIKAEADKLKEIASNEKLSFNERITALKAQLDLTNQMTFESEDAKRDYIKSINDQIDLLTQTSNQKRLQGIFEQIDAWHNAAKNISNILKISNQDQIAKLDEQSKIRIKAAGDDKDAVLAIERETAIAKNELQNKQIKRDKMMAIIEATINTFKAAAQVFARPAPGDPITSLSIKIAGLVATIAQGIANVASIKKVKLPAGDVSGGGSPGATSAPMQPGISAAVQGQALNAEAINNLSNQAVRAYVMNSDIQNNNQRNAYLQRNARLG